MAATYESIATANGDGSTPYIQFSSIPSTYTDLVLEIAHQANAGEYIDMRFNGDTASNYSYGDVGGNNSTAYASQSVNQSQFIWSGTPGSTGQVAYTVFNIQEYSNSNYYKSLISLGGYQAETRVHILRGLWRGTATINTIRIYTNGGGVAWSTNTTMTLYGIKAA